MKLVGGAGEGGVCDTAGGGWLDDHVDDDGVDDDGVDDDGVNDGLRPPVNPEDPEELEEPVDVAEPDATAEPSAADDRDGEDDGDGRLLMSVPAAAPPAWLESCESLLDERANQLLVAAIACLTA